MHVTGKTLSNMVKVDYLDDYIESTRIVAAEGHEVARGSKVISLSADILWAGETRQNASRGLKVMLA